MMAKYLEDLGISEHVIFQTYILCPPDETQGPSVSFRVSG